MLVDAGHRLALAPPGLLALVLTRLETCGAPTLTATAAAPTLAAGSGRLRIRGLMDVDPAGDSDSDSTSGPRAAGVPVASGSDPLQLLLVGSPPMDSGLKPGLPCPPLLVVALKRKARLGRRDRRRRPLEVASSVVIQVPRGGQAPSPTHSRQVTKTNGGGGAEPGRASEAVAPHTCIPLRNILSSTQRVTEGGGEWAKGTTMTHLLPQQRISCSRCQCFG